MRAARKPRRTPTSFTPSLPRSTRPDFYIMDVARDLGIPTDDGPRNVRVGVECSRVFREKYGRLPGHQLRGKTLAPNGVHCFCVYPGSFWDDVVQIWLSFAKPPPVNLNPLFPNWPKPKPKT